MRRGMTVVGQRVVHELRGECCFELGTIASTRQGSAVTRSFSQSVEDLATMEQAIGIHATRLAHHMAIVFPDQTGTRFGASSGPSDLDAPQTPRNATAFVDMRC